MATELDRTREQIKRILKQAGFQEAAFTEGICTRQGFRIDVMDQRLIISHWHNVPTDPRALSPVSMLRLYHQALMETLGIRWSRELFDRRTRLVLPDMLEIRLDR